MNNNDFSVENIYEDKFKYLTSVCLNVTDSCNLKCRYCFVTQQPHFMSYDTAKAAIDFLVNNLYTKIDKGLALPGESAHVNFFGGEPTLMWDQIIEPLVTYATEKYGTRDITFGITTNGTLLDENKIDFLFSHNMCPLLSFDGVKEAQEYDRPCHDENLSSYDLIMKNIPKLLEKFPQMCMRPTIYQPTVQYAYDTYLFGERLGFKEISYVLNQREAWMQDKIDILLEQYHKIFQYIQSKIEDGKPFPHFKTFDSALRMIAEHDINVLKKENWHFTQCRNCHRCGLGTEEGSIGYDGKIYGCQEQTSRCATNDPFEIGSIFEGGINIEKQKELIGRWCKPTLIKCSDNERCKTCLIQNTCREKSCPSWSFDAYNDFETTNEINCILEEFCVKEVAKVMRYLTTQTNQYFKDYLFQVCGYADFMNIGEGREVEKRLKTNDIQFPEGEVLGTYFYPLKL